VPDTDDMAIFARIIELGSLSAAGRDMRLSPARWCCRTGRRSATRTMRSIRTAATATCRHASGVFIDFLAEIFGPVPYWERGR
jgi:hypothetical protein